jgi:pyruvate dehydrogenase E1 component alpha subunit
VGLAYGVKYKGLKGAAMAFMGDGAVNQGAVHEAYNLASLWNLPVVFVIENNRYSMGTSQERSSAGELAQRAAGYDMEWGQCRGHDIYEVRAMMDKFLRLAREKSRPSTVEIDTYRYRGHSVADPDNTYRSKKEIEEYRRTKDPLQVFQNELVAGGVLTDEIIARVDQEARAEADAAADFAEASPYPNVEDIQKDVYWEADHPAERTSQGRLFFD